VSKRILIVGGAGYIGSHANKQLHKLGWNPRRGDLDEIIGSAWNWHVRNG